MGSQTKYARKGLVYVAISVGEPQGDPPTTPENVKYGFFTNVPSSYGTVLGHVPIPESQYADPPNGLVVGCSFPKPRRASKKETNRYVSSFVAKTKIDDARRGGYRIARSRAKSKIILTASNSLVESVYVTLRGIKYGWNIPKVTETNAGNLGALGIIKAKADDRDELCFGANFPKPPRATKTVISGNDIKTITTFYDPSKTDAPGWNLSGGGILAL